MQVNLCFLAVYTCQMSQDLCPNTDHQMDFIMVHVLQPGNMSIIWTYWKYICIEGFLNSYVRLKYKNVGGGWGGGGSYWLARKAMPVLTYMYKYHSVPPGIRNPMIVEFSMEFRLESGSTGRCGTTWFGAEKSRKSWLSMALGKISIFWAQNVHSWVRTFHFLHAEFRAVCLEHHCNLQVSLAWNLHFLSAEFFWAVYLLHVLVDQF